MAASNNTKAAFSTQDVAEARDVPAVSFQDLANRADVTDAIERAFGYDGMGILAVSNVPGLDPRRDSLLPLAFKFANLPEDVKKQYELPEAYYSFGWSHGKENLQGKPDFSKGSYYNNPEENDPSKGDEKLVQKYPATYHPNIWPKEVPQMEAAFLELGKLIVDCGILVSEQCDRLVEKQSPNYEKGKLQRIISTSKVAKARLLHYFEMSEGDIQTQQDTQQSLEESFSWCGWHNDHGALTGLVQAMYLDSDGEPTTNPDPAAGLYVKNRQGEILRANMPTNHLIFQIGEAAQVLSGGVLQATPHAVRGPRVPGVNRETLAVFMQPKPEEAMHVPNGINPEEAGQTKNLPIGVPPLLQRWNNEQNFDDFVQATLKAYY